MSVVYCEYCHKYIDLDYNSEHFIEDAEGNDVCERWWQKEQEDKEETNHE